MHQLDDALEKIARGESAARELAATNAGEKAAASAEHAEAMAEAARKRRQMLADITDEANKAKDEAVATSTTMLQQTHLCAMQAASEAQRKIHSDEMQRERKVMLAAIESELARSELHTVRMPIQAAGTQYIAAAASNFNHPLPTHQNDREELVRCLLTGAKAAIVSLLHDASPNVVAGIDTTLTCIEGGALPDFSMEGGYNGIVVVDQTRGLALRVAKRLQTQHDAAVHARRCNAVAKLLGMDIFFFFLPVPEVKGGRLSSFHCRTVAMTRIHATGDSTDLFLNPSVSLAQKLNATIAALRRIQAAGVCAVDVKPANFFTTSTRLTNELGLQCFDIDGFTPVSMPSTGTHEADDGLMLLHLTQMMVAGAFSAGWLCALLRLMQLEFKKHASARSGGGMAFMASSLQALLDAAVSNVDLRGVCWSIFTDILHYLRMFLGDAGKMQALGKLGTDTKPLDALKGRLKSNHDEYTTAFEEGKTLLYDNTPEARCNRRRISCCLSNFLANVLYTMAGEMVITDKHAGPATNTTAAVTEADLRDEKRRRAPLLVDSVTCLFKEAARVVRATPRNRASS
jgi:hypothetical protein